MKKNVFRSFFQAWCSAQSVLLFLFIVYLVVLAVRSFDLGGGEMASWVQAFGAIISIWAAWWIASQQSKRSEAERRRGDIAKCTVILSLLEYVLRVVKHEIPEYQSARSGRDVRESLAKTLLMLDRIDMLSLPDPIVVSAVFEVRRAVEIFDLKLKECLRIGSNDLFKVHYDFGLSRSCVTEVRRQIELCKEAIDSL